VRLVQRLVQRLVSLPSLVLACAALAALAAPAEAETQEAFICTIREGKNLEDLMKVAKEFASSVGAVEGSAAYGARILTPIASQDLRSVIWIGSMPSFASLAAFNDAYAASDVNKKLDPKFQAVVDCQSRSFWQVHDVK